MNTKRPSPPKSSWQSSSQWYNDSVGKKGHYYHQSIIIPKSLHLLELTGAKDFSSFALLDLACGQGVLSRHLPQAISYTGIDAAKSLIADAKEMQTKGQSTEFFVGDVTKPLPIKKVNYTHAAVILALQNIEHPKDVFLNAAKHLQPGGKFLIILNHPCFRIPRQSSWQVDEKNKIQYRRIDRYLSPMKIPIQTHPSKGALSQQTLSFHHPLSSYSHWLKEAGFSIECIDEWCSDKESEGKAAKMENRSREEIPLFMAILAKKM